MHGVQLMLIHRGFDIEADGYFGPATDAAVRQFQESAGVAVDGLVGSDTWGALYDPEYLPGVDNNGNGKVDPWELILDPGTGSGEGDAWVGRSFPYPQFSTGEGSHAGSASIDGVTVWTVWPVGEGPNGSYHGLLLFTGNGTGTLLLASGAGAQPTTLTVVDAIDIGQSSLLALGCSVDGVADPTISAMVTMDTTSPELAVSTDLAWRFSAGNERIEPLDAAQVDCTSGSLVVD